MSQKVNTDKLENLSRQELIEKKLAARLGITPRKVAIHAVKLWGRTLTAEREARLENRLDDTLDNSARSLRTTRGHITRELTAELTHAITGD